MLTAKKIIKILKLKPLPQEGGLYRETYRSSLRVDRGPGTKRSLGTSIYYLITPEGFSSIHRVSSDEIFHFYLGDPVEMLLLDPGGGSKTVILGPDIEKGQHPQFLVPKNVWQGSRLAPGGRLALLGTTVFPGFDFADYRQGIRKELLKRYPKQKAMITKLTILSYHVHTPKPFRQKIVSSDRRHRGHQRIFFGALSEIHPLPLAELLRLPAG